MKGIIQTTRANTRPRSAKMTDRLRNIRRPPIATHFRYKGGTAQWAAALGETATTLKNRSVRGCVKGVEVSTAKGVCAKHDAVLASTSLSWFVNSQSLGS